MSEADRTKGRVLVVDDAESVRSYLASLLEARGYEVDTAGDGRSAVALLEGGADPDVVLLDVMMPGIDGIETLRRIRDLDFELPVVMLSVVGRASTIVEAMQLGAADYLNKPFEEADLELTLDKVLEKRRLHRERDELQARLRAVDAEPVWRSAAMCAIHDIIRQTADTDVTVLIQGESGVGKEIVARAVHSHSSRAEGAFVKVNCAALPADLLESELFGYEKGAFTGAVGRKQGKFEVAHGGTIFLDEIGEMSPALQAKLLQVLQDAEFSPLGSNEVRRVDVRVVCATNRDLAEMVRERGFREDLYFRLNVVNIEIPPLRERRDDVPALIESFLARYCARYRRPPRELSPELLEAFARHPFPGNVRELENAVKRIVVLDGEDAVLRELARPPDTRRRGQELRALIAEVEESAGELPLREVGRRVARQAERETIEAALQRTDWNRKQAAELLGVSYKTLLQKIRNCGLEAD